MRDINVSISIVRWVDQPMGQVRVIHNIQDRVTHIGIQTLDLSEEGINVEKGDFVMIVADEQNPSPITYMKEHDHTSFGSYLQMSLIKDVDKWVIERMVFALLFDVDPQENTVDGDY